MVVNPAPVDADFIIALGGDGFMLGAGRGHHDRSNQSGNTLPAKFKGRYTSRSIGSAPLKNASRLSSARMPIASLVSNVAEPI